MDIGRRKLIVAAAAFAVVDVPSTANAREHEAMYGLIGKMIAKQGQRAALAAVLLEGVSGMPGCRSYIVANDPVDPDLLWITEVWESREAHAASLDMPSVKAAIGKGRPMISGMEAIAETTPLGGHGLT